MGAHESTSKRRLAVVAKILEKMVKGESASKDELVDLVKHIGVERPEAAVKADIDYLLSIRFPLEKVGDGYAVPPIGLTGLWRGTAIGDRLLTPGHKPLLAKTVIDLLVELGDDIGAILLGTGTTMYEVTKALIERREELNVSNVYSSNLLVLREFIHRRPTISGSIKFELSNGQLCLDTASLIGGTSYLADIEVDAVVTSAKSLDIEHGLSTGELLDVPEKQMNLLPHPHCKYVFILLEWPKIAGSDLPLADPKKGQEPLNFFNVNEGREYCFVVNVPEKTRSNKDRDRLKVLNWWDDQEGIRVVRVSRPKA